MSIISELYQIDSIQSVFKETFSSNKRKWEMVQNESETAEINEGNYWMKNKSMSDWNYYKTKSSLKQNQDFILESDIELVEKEDAYGHFGLVWGFDEKLENLNRFTISADGRRALIMHFEKDHNRVFHRFHIRNTSKYHINKKIRFSLIKLGDYFHFLINKEKIYCAHVSLFCKTGNFIGFYIEPALSIKSDYIELKKMKTKKLMVANGIQQLVS
jgi:hypothetical protein